MKRWKVYVLRLNHRPSRDKRVTTHLFLTARAFGADGAFYSGQKDERIERSMEKVNESWGGNFEVKYVQNWRKVTKEWKKHGGEVIHLTMYGLPAQKTIEQISESPKDKLLVVGGAKVPGEIYELADWNVSITSQPHSEISALSVFLHMLFGGEEFSVAFKGAKMKIVPQSKGKKVVRIEP